MLVQSAAFQASLPEDENRVAGHHIVVAVWVEAASGQLTGGMHAHQAVEMVCMS